VRRLSPANGHSDGDLDLWNDLGNGHNRLEWDHDWNLEHVHHDHDFELERNVFRNHERLDHHKHRQLNHHHFVEQYDQLEQQHHQLHLLRRWVCDRVPSGPEADGPSGRSSLRLDERSGVRLRQRGGPKQSLQRPLPESPKRDLGLHERRVQRPWLPSRVQRLQREPERRVRGRAHIPHYLRQLLRVLRCKPSMHELGCGPLNTFCNGAWVNLLSLTNCSACGIVCHDPQNGAAVCTNTGCSAICNPGYTPVGIGCVDENSDPTCCGAACATCTAPFGGKPACIAGSCVGACPTGMTVCNGECVDTQRDSANCNGCGTICTGICTGGVCDPTAKRVIANGTSVSFLAADGASVFWLDNGSDIMQVARDGSTAPIDLAPTQQFVTNIAVDANFVYWGNHNSGAIWKAAKGVPGALFAGGVITPSAIAVNASSIYWYSASIPPGGPPAGSVAKPMGSPMISGWGTTSVFSVDDSYVYFPKADPGPLPPYVVRANLDGSNPMTVTTAMSNVQLAFAVGSGNVGALSHTVGATWATFGGATWGFPYTGGGGLAPHGIAVEACNMFFVMHGTTAPPGITRLPYTAGPAENLSTGTPPTFQDQIAIDDLFVYTVDSTGAIWRTAK